MARCRFRALVGFKVWGGNGTKNEYSCPYIHTTSYMYVHMHACNHVCRHVCEQFYTYLLYILMHISYIHT